MLLLITVPAKILLECMTDGEKPYWEFKKADFQLTINNYLMTFQS